MVRNAVGSQGSQGAATSPSELISLAGVVYHFGDRGAIAFVIAKNARRGGAGGGGTGVGSTTGTTATAG